MIETLPRRQLLATGVFALAFLAVLFLRLLPLSAGRAGWPGPDLGLCLLTAWLVRRPEQVPALLVAALYLIEDIVLQRPIGLWAVVVVIGSESFRARESRWREQSFLVEWLQVAIVIGAMMLGYRLVQALTLLPVPALGQVILYYLATVFAYPLVVIGARALFGLRHAQPGAGETGRFRR